MENELKEVSLGQTQEIELPKLEVEKYIGKKIKIANVKELDGKYGYCIKAETEVLETLPREEGEVEIRAGRIFGLQKDKDGKVGWGKDTKLGQFLQKMGASHYRDLVGKEVTVQSKTGKDGKDFLEFN